MKKKVLAIELDDYTLKLMQGHITKKGWSIDKFGISDVSGKPDEDIVRIIKDKLHKLKLKKANSVFVIPRSSATVRYLELPASTPSELRNMVDIQVVRQIPYTREEMVYDYETIGLTDEGYVKILLVIAHKDIVSKYLNILEKAGIVPRSIELDSLALSELCKFINTGSAKIFTDEKPVAIIDIDYATTNIIILQKGIPIFTRAVSIGAMHIYGKTPPQPGRDWMNEWIGEISRSLIVFQREQTIPIEKIVVFGDNSGRLIPLAEQKLGFSVTGFNFSEFIEGVSVKTEEVLGIEISVASLLGLIREGVNTSVNLIPVEIINRRLEKGRKKSLVVSLLLICGIIGMLWLTFDKKMHDMKVYLSKIETQLQETGPMAKELMVKKERLALIKNQLSVSGTSLDILRELYSVIPQKTSLNLFVYDDEQGVTIRGTSPAMSDVFDLIPRLENSPYFKNVKSPVVTQKKTRERELTEFQIDCSITAPEEG